MSNPLSIIKDELLLHRARFLHREEAWVYAGQKDDLVFGLLKNGKSEAHRLVWNTKTNSFQCTCPFPQRPCLHLAVLFLDYEAGKFEEEIDLPSWLAIEKTALPNHSEAVQKSIEKAIKNEENRLKTKEERIEKTRHGLMELEAWLIDLVRRGIAPTLSESPEWNEAFASRVADASMTSLSRKIRLFGHQQDLEKLPAELGAFWLAKRAFEKGTSLEDGIFQDMLNFLGAQTLRKKDLLQEIEGQKDNWVVMGHRKIQVEGNLNERITWFYGFKSKKYAEYREFRFGGDPFDLPYPTFSVLETKLYFYPSAYPLRAFPDDEQTLKTHSIERVPRTEKFTDLRSDFAKACNKNPWLLVFPAYLQTTSPFLDEKGRFYLKDAYGSVLPLVDNPDICWALLAASGGVALDVFGEWNGYFFLPV